MRPTGYGCDSTLPRDVWRAPDLLPLLDDGPDPPIAAALKVELHLLGKWPADTLPFPNYPSPSASQIDPCGAASVEAAVVNRGMNHALSFFLSNFLSNFVILLVHESCPFFFSE